MTSNKTKMLLVPRFFWGCLLLGLVTVFFTTPAFMVGVIISLFRLNTVSFIKGASSQYMALVSNVAKFIKTGELSIPNKGLKA
ncbi:hypothetical protein VCHA53O466_50040 [Vibrio chagasii]|nr:hypothetical protein VCHA53O466_50040 [Vibrio chagasii]